MKKILFKILSPFLPVKPEFIYKDKCPNSEFSQFIHIRAYKEIFGIREYEIYSEWLHLYPLLRANLFDQFCKDYWHKVKLL